MNVDSRAKWLALPERDELEAVIGRTAHRGGEHVLVEQPEIDLAAASVPDELPPLAKKPRFEHILENLRRGPGRAIAYSLLGSEGNIA
jgi:hypothetical protein